MACSPSRRDQIADLGAGRIAGDAAGELLEHITTCAVCSHEFDQVADLMAARTAITGRVMQAVPAAEPFRRLLPLLAAAALLLAAVLVWRPWQPAKSLQQLASLTPLRAPEVLLRGEPGMRGPDFRRGMLAYAQGDFAAASAALRIVCTKRPDDGLAQLYLGIAELQGETPDNALAPLAAASQHGKGLVRERALWYLANAHLQAGRLEASRTVLEQLRAIDGDYRLNAEQLLAQLAGH